MATTTTYTIRKKRNFKSERCDFSVIRKMTFLFFFYVKATSWVCVYVSLSGRVWFGV